MSQPASLPYRTTVVPDSVMGLKRTHYRKDGRKSIEKRFDEMRLNQVSFLNALVRTQS
jgi:hypothetical protein